MSITAIAPFISCVCNSADFEEAVTAGYKEIYVVTTKGIFKHHILRGEKRFIQIKVDSIPGYKDLDLKEDISSFLPAGKVPFHLYQQVEKFFRDVIRTKGTALEAMIFVMWSQEQGYYLHVPNQKVGGASVTYDYNGFPSGSSIVINIHSHGHMNAFFSGTDDNNDSTKIQYSGVFGKFQDPQCTTVWRFNYYTKKFPASVTDLFLPPPIPEVEIPSEWLDKVEIHTPVVHSKSYYPTTVHQGSGKNNRRSFNHTLSDYEDMLDEDFYNFNGFTPSQGSGAVTPSVAKNTISLNGQKKADPLDKFVHVNGRYQLKDSIELTPTDIAALANKRPTIEEDDIPTLSEIVARAVGSQHELDENDSFWAQNEKNFTTLTEDPSIDNDVPGSNDEVYEQLAVTHGVDVADAWFDISNSMVDLNGKDDIVNSLVLELSQMASAEGQVKIFKDMFENLSPREKEKIQTTGL